MSKQSAVSQQEIAKRMRGVKWHGRYFACLCPFHEDNRPSLLVYPDGAFCLGCQKRYSLAKLAGMPERNRPVRAMVGDTPDFTRDFPSVEDFAMEAHEILLRYPQQRSYLVERGIDSAIERLFLGWWDGWYTFPVRQPDNTITAVVMRASPSIQSGVTDKYVVLPKGTMPGLYFPEHRLCEKAGSVFVPFGVIDAVSLDILRLPSATPYYGQTANGKLFAGLRKTIVVLPDKGEEQTASRLVRQLDWRGKVVNLNYESNEKDANDIFVHNRKRLTAQLSQY